MKNQIKLLLSVFWAMVFSVPIAAGAQQQIAYGVDSNVDSLYTINMVSGAIAVVGLLGSDSNHYTTPISMAVRHSDGAIFVANNSPDVDRGISRVDPRTGKATLVVPSDVAFNALTFDAQDRLIARRQSRTL